MGISNGITEDGMGIRTQRHESPWDGGMEELGNLAAEGLLIQCFHMCRRLPNHTGSLAKPQRRPYDKDVEISDS